ncbi:Serine phosphatase RsbU subunit sigma [Melioribacter roseus P3M-2]|uniref:Serine phosphatase RsbU subunit sigma n=1 Tax=Melioribacter roseus (strain DSM 23840 / JCM 17771 / VKM B-2668 / P3M-2) TaxID=1191523 RepID=I6Z7F3_MELRP|nr:GAF domain-containing SpoIIE family protein phosphatase [Melioribacter roseus]AFN75090.1 Serine phosphatase RsbU subunit sigma [Melioribacter roseus P3M-2]
MNLKNVIKFTRSRSLENAAVVSVLLLIYNFIFPIHSNPIVSLVNEVLVFLTIFFIYNYISPYTELRKDAPLSLVLNAGILGALVFFVISLANSAIGDGNSIKSDTGAVNTLFTTVLNYIFIIVLAYIFSTFRTLYYLRQKKDQSLYFNTMLFFFVMTFFSEFANFSSSLDFIHDAFFIVTIVLISLNSLKVSWIAFLTKKQKLYLLLISIILSILFGFNFGLLNESNVIKMILFKLSVGLYTVFSLVMIYGMIYFGVIFFTTLFHLPTAEAFDRRSEEISSLMDLTKLITQVFDFKELADSIINFTTKICNSNAAWLVTISEDGIEVTAVNNIGYVEARLAAELFLKDSVKGVYSITTADEIDERFNFRTVAVAPLNVHNKLSGYLFTARLSEVDFDKDEKNTLQTYADYASVALENAKLIAESIEKERLEKELDVARDVQRKILPVNFPVSDNYELSALFIPAFEVGGDYYDFFELSDNRLGFIVADVSGKGISAAFIMAELKGIFESLAKIVNSPTELLIKANEILKDSLDKKNFVTAVYGILDYKNGIMKIARAGHTPIIYCSAGKISRLLPKGIGLGLDYSAKFENSLEELEINLKDGDVFVIYSDGIPEAKNSMNEDFGYDRFENIISSNCKKNLDGIANEIVKEITLFSKDHTQHDDITLVIIRWSS